MARRRPSQPFCATMQTMSTRPLLLTIAGILPLGATLSWDHPQFAEDADVCNPLLHWIQAALGFLLPALVQLASDYNARLRFAERHFSTLSEEDRVVWRANYTSAFSPWPLAAMVLFGGNTLLWYLFFWKQMLPMNFGAH